MLRKKLSSIIAVALCMAFGLSACGNSETPAASSDSTQAVSEDASADAGDTTASDADGGEDLEDMAEIEMYYYAFIAPKDVQHVEDAVNAITEDAINVHVNINVLDVNSFIQQMSIMMAEMNGLT